MLESVVLQPMRSGNKLAAKSKDQRDLLCNSDRGEGREPGAAPEHTAPCLPHGLNCSRSEIQLDIRSLNIKMPELQLVNSGILS